MIRFIDVASVESLPPGHGRTVSASGAQIALYNLDGQFYAIDDVCPHAGGQLGEGTLANGSVVCPLHGWSFDLKTGICPTRPDRPVKTFPTRVWEGQVQVEVG